MYRAFFLILFCSQSIVAQDRSYLEINEKIVVDLSEYDIYKPLLLTVDNDQNAYIYDNGYHRVYKFINGDLALTFGEGLGGGPEEFRNPTNMLYNPFENTIWIVDPQQLRISVWSTEGELVRTNTFSAPENVPSKVAFIDENRYVWKPSFYREDGFELAISTYNGKTVTEIGNIDVLPAKASLLLDGDIVSDTAAIYYSGYRSGFLKKFSVGGKLIFTSKGVEPIPDPVLIEETVDISGYKDIQIIKRPDNHPIGFKGIGLFGDRVYALHSGQVNGFSDTIDVYEKLSGKYRYSIKFSAHVQKVAISGNQLYVILMNKGGRSQLVQALLDNHE